MNEHRLRKPLFLLFSLKSATLRTQYDAIILITTTNKQGIRGNAKEIS